MHEEAGRRRLRGVRAIEAALADGAELRLLLCPEGPLDESVTGLVRTRVAEAEAGSGQDAGAGEGLLALVGPDPAAELEVWLARRGAAWLLTGTAYPGNAGFVVRSAEVSGADGVVIDADFGRDARRECLRAAMRADRFFPVCFTKAVDAVAAARRAGRRIIAVEDSGDRAPWELDLRGAVLFVVGGERQGIPQALLGEADAVLRIPMAGFVPSYNLQAAMAVVMGERLRQLGEPLPGRSAG
ncbi:MAG: hypothetical protein JRG96_17055 [Deltaproteobacteria bacterium]|nr:hypothetical protein [Deltaproteobacteria bacterium]